MGFAHRNVFECAVEWATSRIFHGKSRLNIKYQLEDQINFVFVRETFSKIMFASG